MEVLDNNKIFSDYSFYKYDNDNGNNNLHFIGTYDFSDPISSEIIKKENYIFQEFEMNETNTKNNDPSNNDIYNNLAIIINSDKIKECRVKGFNLDNKRKIKCKYDEYLKLKSKFNNDNMNGTHYFTIAEHEEYNIMMPSDKIKNKYCLGMILKTNIATYSVEIGYTSSNRNGFGRWRTWFDVIDGKNGVKELHVGIHFRTKTDGTECTVLEIDNFVDSQ